MDTLENYLMEEHPVEKRDIAEIEDYLKKVVPIFIAKFDEDRAWPYEIQFDDASKVMENKSSDQILSLNTTAMIVNALLRLTGKFKSGPSREIGNISKANIFPLRSDTDKETIDDIIKKASKLVLEKITDKQNNKSLKTKSATFGTNDIFSLAWLAEISIANWEEIDSKQSKKWEQAQEGVFIVASKKLADPLTFSEPKSLFNPDKPSKPLPHAFPALRLLQIIRHIKGSSYGPLPNHYKYFETLLHQQLSFSSIPDSRFDPAELMFCLEGMLLCQKNIVDRTLFDRVLTVLTSRQLESPYWRPVMPYMATAQGLVLFPVSVEIANSLLRACAIFDGDELHGTYSSQCIVLLRRYWQWLRARAVKFKRDQEEYVGWHSEHVNSPNVIHLWETSQVVEFLLSYRNALYVHIGRTTLVRSRFTYKNTKSSVKEWVPIEKDLEPVKCLGEGLCIYKKIGQYFVIPHQNESPKDYSMLLYGPPGTGKTTVAKKIAEALGYRLITITVSDFLAEGGVQVENRAKSIFEVLNAQQPCVILFDEIDHFLLDRDSERYSKQDTVFQFMTPGMLTKLNDLRGAEHVLFIIATNYEDRIDAAIKRPGRIDHQFLVLPPDLAGRRALLNKILSDDIKEFTSV
ncbi:MAG: ATP-binding protein, partial [Nitrosospira sp.]